MLPRLHSSAELQRLPSNKKNRKLVGCFPHLNKPVDVVEFVDLVAGAGTARNLAEGDHLVTLKAVHVLKTKFKLDF
jgi:hypothetical protein